MAGGDGFWDEVDAGVSPGGGALALLHVREEYASGTNVASTAGSWVTRTLNTTVTNEITGASRASNEITLPAGTYEIEARVPGYAASRHKARLYNVTAAAPLLVGSSMFASGGNAQNDSIIRGRFTLAGTSALRIEHRVQAAAAEGFGVASGFGVVEVYTDVLIRQVS